MSGTLKKTITWLAILAILGVTIFGIVWLSNNFGKLQSGTDLYTKEDLDKKYDEGYKKGQEEGEISRSCQATFGYWRTNETTPKG